MIDSHAHVAVSQFDDDRDEVITRAFEGGVTGWLEVGTDLAQSKLAVEIANKYENVYATVGVHPSDIAEFNDEAWLAIEDLAEKSNVVAIGEVGLDLYRGGNLEQQKDVLGRFVEIAVRRDMPMIFHMRSSDDIDVNQVMIEYLVSLPEAERPRGVLHTFSGNMEQAKQYLDMGMYLSFSGVVTFKNATELQAIAREVPLDKILIETDCPFLAPEPHRGQRNEPAYVKYVAEKIAEIREVSIEEVEKVTEENTRLLFRL